MKLNVQKAVSIYYLKYNININVYMHLKIKSITSKND